MDKPGDIDLNEQFQKALNLMEGSPSHVFITGKAGTGKSTLLEYFREHTKKKIAVLAPTGVAALNVRGQTIHSFFKFQADVTLEKIESAKKRRNKLYKKLDAIVVDEVSMVRADLLDCMDAFLRRNGPKAKQPFGGVQMVFIGDLYQLPPVVAGQEREAFRQHYPSPYFFDAKVFENIRPEFVELEKIYRQKDAAFVGFLNALRNNTVTERDLALINTRVDPSFQEDPQDFFITITTTNALAAEINEKKLHTLSGRPVIYSGSLAGNFGKQYLPTGTELTLKTGAQVMMVNNDSKGRWVNGSIGHVEKIEKGQEGSDRILVKLSDAGREWVEPYSWELFKISYDDKANRLVSETIGTFTQYPLRLAWAVTIHKSQGKTFTKVIIDLGRGTFAHGQAYVALSRCTTLEGIVLRKPLLKKHVWMDWRVVRFLTQFQYQRSLELHPLEEKVRRIQDAIDRGEKLRIVYLQNTDVKSVRVIRPVSVGQMEYLEKSYLGLEAHCFLRDAKRIFRVDRILAIEERGGSPMDEESLVRAKTKPSAVLDPVSTHNR